jgi:hypothetical protein
MPTEREYTWQLSTTSDRFEEETTYTAKTAYEKIVGYTDTIGLYKKEFMSLGLRCDVSKGSVKKIMIRFSFERPLAYYSVPILFMVDANDQVFRFRGNMFSNSMSSGYASIEDHEQLNELLDALSRGKAAVFKVDPDGSGEDREESVTLRGSAKAIAQWKKHCL